MAVSAPAPALPPTWRPLLLSPWSVRQTLDNGKSQTRRLIRPQPTLVGEDWIVGWHEPGKPILVTDPIVLAACPFGQPGDRLWVKERWAWSGEVIERRDGDPVYRADGDGPWPWRSSRFMPRWASRLSLEVVRVWVEQVIDITEGDAIHEGIEWDHDHQAWYAFPGSYHARAEDAYAEVWDSLHAKKKKEAGRAGAGGCTFQDAPWVWCLWYHLLREPGGEGVEAL